MDRNLDPNRPASPQVTQPLARLEPIGRYALQHTLAKSAGSVVYAALDPDTERSVAIKVFTLGDGTALEGQRVRRLQREAELLSRSAHPHLIRVYTFGIEKDRAYLVMELLENSVTLGRWLEQKPRTWQEVLDVFIQAGQGLAFAHRAGVVHRDFKADNVLIGEDGRARVTDFGHLSSRVEERPMLEGADVLTAEKLDAKLERAKALQEGPSYLAPEQKSGIPAGPAADQYSFCFALRLALQGATDAPPTARNVHRVIAQGLELRPTARFPRMETLLRALNRGVHGPLWKQRPKLTLALGGGAIALLGALIIIAATDSPQGAASCGAEGRLDNVWTHARKQQLQEAGTPIPTLEALDASAQSLRAAMRHACSLARARGGTTDAVDRQAFCLELNLQELSAVADVAQEQTNRTAEPLTQVAQELRSAKPCAEPQALAALPEPPPEPAQLARVAAVHYKIAFARTWGRLGLTAREQDALEAAALAAKQVGDRGQEAELLYLKGAKAFAGGEAAKAEELLFQALEAAEAGRSAEVTALAAVDLSRVLAESRPEESERWLKLGVAAGSRASLGPAFEGRVDLQRARLALRRQEWEKAVALAQKSLPAIPRDGPAGWEARTVLAEALERQGKTADACRNAADALDAAQRLYGAESLRTAQNLAQRSRCALAEEKEPEALALLQAALKVQQKALGPEHLEVARTLSQLGLMQWQLERYGEALTTTRQGLAAFEKARGVRDPEYLDALCKYAGMTLGAGRRDDAIKLYEKAIKGLEEVYGARSPELAGPLTGIGKSYYFIGQYARAHGALQLANNVSDAKRDAYARAETQFYLAKAIWALDGDRLRAVRLAMDAAGTYRAGGEPHQHHLESVETWLAKRGSAVAARR